MIVAAEEEGDIQVSKDFQMEDIVEMGYQKKHSAANIEAKYENKTLWSYADAYKNDNRNGQQDGELGTAAASSIMTIDERIKGKLAEYEIDVAAQLGVVNN